VAQPTPKRIEESEGIAAKPAPERTEESEGIVQDCGSVFFFSGSGSGSRV
jgi:hypothetical protein